MTRFSLRARAGATLLALACLAGCTQTPAPAPVKPVPPDPSSVRFDAASGEVEAFSVNVPRHAGDWAADFPVTLAADGSPAILGTYTARGPYVRFLPRFPFVPAQTYRAELRVAPDGPAVTKFTLPAPPLPPPAQVTAV